MYTIALLITFMASTVFAKMEKVQFTTLDNVKLNARIYGPDKSKQQGPAVLMIEGFGKSRLKKEPESSPFFQLASALSKKGFVVMVYNKRGSSSNSNNGSWAKATFTSDNQDAQAALDFLKAQKTVAKERIYLFGQSIGCLHASVLAQKNDVKGVVLFAGGYQNFFKIIEEQNLEILRLGGKSADESKVTIAPMILANSDLREGKLNCEKYKTLCQVEDGATIVDGGQADYLSEVFKMDPVGELAKVKAPALILQGTSDFVISQAEFELAKKTLASQNNFSFELLEKVDHFMAEHPDKAASLNSMEKIAKTKKLFPLSKQLARATQDWLEKQERSKN